MQAKSDSELLRAYAVDSNEAAFGELVARYTNLVHSAALRQVDAPDLARDVAQSVFFDLARKASALSRQRRDGAWLIGWLYQSTRYAALSLRREARRRQSREREAMEGQLVDTDPALDWSRLRPILDAAMAHLGAPDRTALLLRFFKNQGFRAVGQALDVSDDAAQKRVERALEKLRAYLVRRGITTSTAALAANLAAHSVQAAPAGLAAALASASLASAAAGVGSTMTLLKILTMTKLKLTLISVATLAALTAPWVVEQQTRHRLQEAEMRLQRQQAQLAHLTVENRRLTGLADRARSAQSLADQQQDELLRLRGEVGVLRSQTNELAATKQENARLRAQLASGQKAPTGPALGTVIPQEAWAFTGYATPEAAAESVMWAMKTGKVKTFLASLSPELQVATAQEFAGKSESEIAAGWAGEISHVAALRLDRKQVSPDGAITFTFGYQAHGNGAVTVVDNTVMTFRNLGGEWKVAGPPEPQPAK